MKGLTHIIYGMGKGKTTGAVGCALRAAGSGMKVVFVSLMKDGTSSENSMLEKCGIKLMYCDRNYGFTFEMTDKDKQEITACHNALLGKALELAQNGEADMLVIDELFCAYEYGLCDKELAKSIVSCKPENVELVLTGHDPDEFFLQAADYVSRVESPKHPYEKGIAARKGIEF